MPPTHRCVDLNKPPEHAPSLGDLTQETLETLRDWPWYETFRTLKQRFREDRLGLTAGSLTFTTMIAIVPLVTVMLAIFTAFPMFGSFQQSLQDYFLRSLVPDAIARPVLKSLTQFASQAHSLGAAGLAFLLGSALTLMLTIDRTLNALWRVPKPRPIAQRVLVYWAATTLGPLVLGVSLSMTSYAVSVSEGLIGGLPGAVELVLDGVQFLLLAAGMAGLFHYVPNTHVRWRHAMAGGMFVAIGFEIAKRVLAAYVKAIPTFSTVYGAFATFPIFLLWMYMGWVIVLLGAVIAAYAPSLRMRVVRLRGGPGQLFALGILTLQQLDRARLLPQRGMTIEDLGERLRVDPLQLEPLLEWMIDTGWVARIDEDGLQRHILLCDVQTTPAGPLIESYLLMPTAATRAFRVLTGLERLRLGDLMRA